MQYRNPLIPGFYPDPSICKGADGYYLVTSSFEFFPGVPIFHSTDLINWKQIGHCLTRKSQLDLENIRASKGIYAATIRYHDGVFYMVTTNTTKIGNFYVTATDPAGEWSDPILVEQGGIDPSLFWDEEGVCHFISNADAGNGHRFLMGPIDVKTGKFLRKPQPMWPGAGGQAPEAPHIYQKDGWFYQLNAEGGTELGHSITIARSRSLYGPFEACPNNPILTHRERKRWPIQATGHGDMIEDDDGNWWIVFLGYRQTSQYFHHLGRETFLAPVKWVDGWPVIYDNKAIEPLMTVEGVREAVQSPRPSLNTGFENGIPMHWVHLRNPELSDYRTENGLLLRGSAYHLSDVANPTFVGIRQTDLNSRSSVTLSFDPAADNEEAGYSVFYKFDAHYEIAVTRRDGKRVVLLRKVVGDISHIETCVPVDSDAVALCIDSDKDSYRFYVKDGGKTIELGGGLTRHVSTEAHVLGFTGVFLTLYASGNGKACQSWARFTDFRYESLDWE